jgi:hypothetical protein
VLTANFKSINIITKLPETKDISIVDIGKDSHKMSYTIRVPVTIDLRSALSAGISTFRIEVLKSPSSWSEDFVSMAGQEVTPENVNSGLPTFSDDNMEMILLILLVRHKMNCHIRKLNKACASGVVTTQNQTIQE